jgi:hypothetical protein
VQAQERHRRSHSTRPRSSRTSPHRRRRFRGSGAPRLRDKVIRSTNGRRTESAPSRDREPHARPLQARHVRSREHPGGLEGSARHERQRDPDYGTQSRLTCRPHQVLQAAAREDPRASRS